MDTKSKALTSIKLGLSLYETIYHPNAILTRKYLLISHKLKRFYSNQRGLEFIEAN